MSSLNAPDKKNSCIEDYVDPRRFMLRGRLGRCSVELHRGPFYGRLWFFYWGAHETSTATVAARRTGSILACASRFSVNFFAVPAQLRREMTKCEVLFSTWTELYLDHWNHPEIVLLVSPWMSNCEGRCEISFDSVRTQGKFIRENRLTFTFI